MRNKNFELDEWKEQFKQELIKAAEEDKKHIAILKAKLKPRKEVIEELEKRIKALESVAKPNELVTGMTGSHIMFQMYLKTKDVMTDDEFFAGIYDEWLVAEHDRIYELVNGEPI
jgi:predicted RNase H-like nuclease (RuvC/YqgF family)